MKIRRGLAPLAAGTVLVLLVLLPSMPGLVAQTSSPVTGCALATSSSTVTAGGQLGISGGNGCLQRNVTAAITLNSAPVSLGTVPTDSNGNVSTVVTIPSDTAAGTHTIVVSDPANDSASATITVQAAGATPVTAAPSSGSLAATGAHSLVRWTLRGLALLLGGVLIVMGVRRWREVRYWT